MRAAGTNTANLTVTGGIRLNNLPVAPTGYVGRKLYRSLNGGAFELVVLGNPGCHAWIAQAAREHGGRVRVLHTSEALEAAFSGLS